MGQRSFATPSLVLAMVATACGNTAALPPVDLEKDGTALYPGPCSEEHYYRESLVQRVINTYESARVVVRDYDYDADGSIQYRFEYGYDDAGLLVHQTFGSPGPAEVLWRFEHDAAGNVVREEVDNVASPANPDHVRERLFDTRGRLVRETFDGDDEDTAPDLVTRLVYDPDGRWIREETDVGGDGTFESRVVHTLDADGRKARSEYQAIGEPVSSVWTYAYDRRGNLVLEAHQDHRDAPVDYRVLSTYENDLLTWQQTERPGAALPERVLWYTYDDVGHLLLREDDCCTEGSAAPEADGIVDQSVVYDYACWTG